MTSEAGTGLHVKEIGSFHLGGRHLTLSGLPAEDVVYSPGMAPVKVDPNGDFHTGQMYVQYVKLMTPKAKYPLLMWHGGGLSGVTWETKPDGRPGWQHFFLAAGHDVFVSDAVERGRASWSRYPQVFDGAPMFRTKQEAWELFRIGPPGSYATDAINRTAHAGQKFPLVAFDTFAMQSVPRWTTNDGPTQAAYNALVDKVGPCVVMVHSQGGNFGFNAALAHPSKVKAVIAIEPSGAPPPDHPGLATLTGVPQLFVWGDYMAQHPLWNDNIVKAPSAYAKALANLGAPVEVLDLPRVGISGNSHMLMMDTNSDEVAGRIQAWMVKTGLMR
jgi:pimeloyl-ACP methyl ester carboxylesterase